MNYSVEYSTENEMTELDEARNIVANAIEIKHITGAQWDKEIISFDGVCQEQLYVFSKNRWGSVICEPVLFLKNKKIVGGALVLVQLLPFQLGSIAVIKWGPLLKDHSNENSKEIYASCIETLLLEYDINRKMMVSILPRASSEKENFEFDYLLKRGFGKGGELRFPSRYFVNLRLSDEEIKSSFAQKWRYHLNKSLKADLTFERADATRMNEFENLYEQMNERKKFADHSAYDDTIKAMMDIKDDVLRPELFLVKEHGKTVAGAIIFKTGKTATYMYGATSKEALKSRAGYFIHWHVVRWLRDNTKADYYDLGGTDGFLGLHQFKKGMVGTKGVIAPVPAVMNYSSNVFPFLVGHFAFFARDSILRFKSFLSKFKSDLAQPNQKRVK